jgi:hypothetical protein
MSDELRLRDVDDIRAYARKVGSTINVDSDLREDLVQEGLRLICEKERKLPRGASLRKAIGTRVSDEGGSWLRCRLLNWVQASRSDPPAREDGDHPEGASESAESEALAGVALAIFERREDVRDPRVIARYLNEAGLYSGASHRPPGTAASEEIWARIEAARPDVPGYDKSVAPPFRIETDLEL